MNVIIGSVPLAVDQQKAATVLSLGDGKESYEYFYWLLLISVF